jgi:hypothetical protein
MVALYYWITNGVICCGRPNTSEVVVEREADVKGEKTERSFGGKEGGLVSLKPYVTLRGTSR